jgi:hypothetical protein
VAKRHEKALPPPKNIASGGERLTPIDRTKASSERMS